MKSEPEDRGGAEACSSLGRDVNCSHSLIFLKIYLLVEQDVYRIEWSARKRTAWFLLTRLCTCTVTTTEVSGRIALFHITLTKEHAESDVSRGSCLCCFAASPDGPLGVIDAALSRSGTCHTHPVPWSPVGAAVSALQVPGEPPTRWAPQPQPPSRGPPCTRLPPSWDPAVPQPATGDPPPFDFCSTVALSKAFPHLHPPTAFLPLACLGLPRHSWPPSTYPHVNWFAVYLPLPPATNAHSRRARICFLHGSRTSRTSLCR